MDAQVDTGKNEVGASLLRRFFAHAYVSLAVVASAIGVAAATNTRYQRRETVQLMCQRFNTKSAASTNNR